MTFLLESYLYRALLAAFGLVFATAPLGCIVIWRRLAYFGDATAHAALLGVALSLAFSFSIYIGVSIVAIGVAAIIAGVENLPLPRDSLLGITAHSALAFGLIVASLSPHMRLDLHSYLFGDILAVSVEDVMIIWGLSIGIAILIASRWRNIITVTLSNELALAEGISPKKEGWIITLCLAIIVAASIKIVGALLISALLIIPASTARNLSNTPEDMVMKGAVIAALAIMLGIAASYQFDIPTGPSIIALSAIFFIISLFLRMMQRYDN